MRLQLMKACLSNSEIRSVSAATIEELAGLIGAKADQLKASIENFSNYASTGIDLEQNRPADTMRAFDGKAYYAFEVRLRF